MGPIYLALLDKIVPDFVSILRNVTAPGRFIGTRRAGRFEFWDSIISILWPVKVTFAVRCSEVFQAVFFRRSWADIYNKEIRLGVPKVFPQETH